MMLNIDLYDTQKNALYRINVSHLLGFLCLNFTKHILPFQLKKILQTRTERVYL